MARGPPAPGAGSQLAHSASAAAAAAAAAHPLPDSVRPGAGREPPGRLMGAALRAVADSRAGSARGLAGARTQAEGGGPPPEVGRRGEPPASPSDRGSVEKPKPERRGDTSPPPHLHSGLGPRILAGVGLLAGRSRAPAGGMPYPRDLARRLRPGACQAAGPLPAPSLPRTGLGLGVSPRVGRPAGRHSAGGAGGAGCLVPRAWLGASSLGILGPPAFSPMMQLPCPEWLRSGDTVSSSPKEPRGARTSHG